MELVGRVEEIEEDVPGKFRAAHRWRIAIAESGESVSLNCDQKVLADKWADEAPAVGGAAATRPHAEPVSRPVPRLQSGQGSGRRRRPSRLKAVWRQEDCAASVTVQRRRAESYGEWSRPAARGRLGVM